MDCPVINIAGYLAMVFGRIPDLPPYVYYNHVTNLLHQHCYCSRFYEGLTGYRFCRISSHGVRSDTNMLQTNIPTLLLFNFMRDGLLNINFARYLAIVLAGYKLSILTSIINMLQTNTLTQLLFRFFMRDDRISTHGVISRTEYLTDVN